MAQGLAKKMRFLPGSGLRAPRCRLRNLAPLASNGRTPLTPSTTLTNAWVSTLKRRGPVGEAAMLGRYAELRQITTLCSWFGKAEVSSAVPSPLASILKPVTRGASRTSARGR